VQDLNTTCHGRATNGSAFFIKYSYIVFNILRLKVSITAMIGRDLKPQKLLFTKRNLENF